MQVANVPYSTEKIVSAMVLLGFVMMSSLRKDTVLRYVHTGSRTGKRGASKKFDGRLDLENPDFGMMERVEWFCGEEGGESDNIKLNFIRKQVAT